MVANCRTRNAIAAEQWRVQNWYDDDWTAMYRYPRDDVKQAIAVQAAAAANNDNCRYSQPQRMTFFTQFKAHNFNASAITVICYSDCSASTSAMIIAAGYKCGVANLQSFSPSNTTRTLDRALTSVGFVKFTDPKYLNSDNYLQVGDILLCAGKHVLINIGNGALAASDPNGTPITTTSYIQGGDLYGSEKYTRADGLVREFSFADSNGTESLTAGPIHLSIINYTSMLADLFSKYGRTPVTTTTNSVASSNALGGTVTGIQNIIAQTIVNYFIMKGLSAAAGCGIAGNIQRESNFNPAVVNSIGATGLCQWLGGRRTAMILATPNWKNNVTGQLDYLWSELQNSSYSQTLSAMRTAGNTVSDAEKVAEVFCKNFERPGHYDTEVPKRQEYARNIFNQINGTANNGIQSEPQIPAVETNTQNTAPQKPTPQKPTSNNTAQVVRITASALRIRSGPGTNYKIVGKLNKGTKTTINKKQNGWGKLQNGKGWISLKYTTEV